MNPVTRRLRSVLIALAVLALSATAALAGRSALATPQPQVASQHADGDQRDEGETPEGGAAEDTDEADTDEADTDEADTDEADEAPAADAGDAAQGKPSDNHGAAVSEAAKGDTPEGFANHGAYVRTIAHDNHGHATDKVKPEKPAKKH